MRANAAQQQMAEQMRQQMQNQQNQQSQQNRQQRTVSDDGKVRVEYRKNPEDKGGKSNPDADGDYVDFEEVD